MSDINFGSVTDFYFAHETLLEQASYTGKTQQQHETMHTLKAIKTYFKSCYEPVLAEAQPQASEAESVA